jgi:hypothetical protein
MGISYIIFPSKILNFSAMSELFLKDQKYGKSRIRLVKVTRTSNWHEIVELTVINILLLSCFKASLNTIIKKFS